MNMKKIIGLSIAGVALVGLGDSVVRGQKGHGGGGGHPAPHAAAPHAAPHPAARAARAPSYHPTPSFSGARGAPRSAARAPHPSAGAQARFVPSMGRQGPSRTAGRAGPNRTFATRAPNATRRPNFPNASVNSFNRPENRRPQSAGFNRATVNGRQPSNAEQFNRAGINRPEGRFSNRQNFDNFANNRVNNSNRFGLNQRFTGNNFNAAGWRGYNGLGGREGWAGGRGWGGGGGFWNNGGYWNRSWYGGQPWWFWNRPWGWLHAGWFQGCWDWGSTVPSVWLAGAPAGSWLDWQGDNFVYDNPYYVAPSTTVVAPEALDYSAPLPAPAQDEAQSAYPTAPSTDDTEGEISTDSENPVAQTANELFDSAREAFRRGDYAGAQQLVEKAIQQLPSDAVLHEFRALTLFAQEHYSDAASALYAVLAAGPGWNWATMSSLYPDAGVYTQQLRTLEDHIRQNPNDAPARFVLAYHYLVLGSKDEAIKQLQEVVRLQPKDTLSAEILKALTTQSPPNGAAPRPAPQTTQQPQP